MYALPAENAAVMSAMLTTSGSTRIPRFSIDITYGEDPAPGRDSLMAAVSEESFAEHTMPTQRQLPRNMTVSLTKTCLNARGRTLRGSFTSPASIEMYSPPAMVKEAWMRQTRNPWK